MEFQSEQNLIEDNMSLKIVAISDTHSKHRELKIPEADVIVCAGDISYKGELNIIQDFAHWMKELPIKHKLSIFGNHEVGMSCGKKRPKALKMLKDAGIIYLEDSGVEIDGVKFWGSPVQPRYYDWEWNRDRGSDINYHWKLIPDDTNVLITHGPPYGILDLVEDSFENKGRDLHQGCEDLARRVKQLPKLKAHIFGHLHMSSGVYKDCANITYINAAVCSEQYRVENEPRIVEV